MKLRDFIDYAGRELEAAGLPDFLDDAEYLVCEHLNLRPGLLKLHLSDELSDESVGILNGYLCRRKQKEPLQYICGKAYFRELELFVGKGCLIPRPETELLAGYLIDNAPAASAVLDIATGSGAVALAIAFERPDITVIASDISEDALFWTRKNREQYKLPNLSIFKSDLFEAFDGMKFDYITANLPYVTELEYSALEAQVKDYEPQLALVSGADGLDIIRRTVSTAHLFLRENGLIYLECAPEQCSAIADLFRNEASYGNIEIHSDLCGRERFVSAKKI